MNNQNTSSSKYSTEKGSEFNSGKLGAESGMNMPLSDSSPTKNQTRNMDEHSSITQQVVDDSSPTNNQTRNTNEHTSITQQVVDGFRKWTFGESGHEDLHPTNNNDVTSKGISQRHIKTIAVDDKYTVDSNSGQIFRNSKDLQDTRNETVSPTDEDLTQSKPQDHDTRMHSKSVYNCNTSRSKYASLNNSMKDSDLGKSKTPTITKEQTQNYAMKTLPGSYDERLDTDRSMNARTGITNTAGNYGERMESKKPTSANTVGNYGKRMEADKPMGVAAAIANTPNSYGERMEADKPTSFATGIENTSDHYGERTRSERIEKPHTMDPWNIENAKHNGKYYPSNAVYQAPAVESKNTENTTFRSVESSGKGHLNSGTASNADAQYLNSQPKLTDQNKLGQDDSMIKNGENSNQVVGTVDKKMNSQNYGLSSGPYVSKSRENSTSYKHNEDLMHSQKEVMSSHNATSDAQQNAHYSDKQQADDSYITPNTNLDDVHDNYAAASAGDRQHRQDTKHEGKNSRRNSIKDKILNIFGIHKKSNSSSSDKDIVDHNYHVENNANSGITKNSYNDSTIVANKNKSINANAAAMDAKELQEVSRPENRQNTFTGVDNLNVSRVNEHEKSASMINHYDGGSAGGEQSQPDFKNDYDKISGPSQKKHKQSNSVSDTDEMKLKKIRDQQNQNMYNYQNNNDIGNYSSSNVPRNAQVPVGMHDVVQGQEPKDQLNYISSSNAKVYTKDT